MVLQKNYLFKEGRKEKIDLDNSMRDRIITKGNQALRKARA